MKVIFTDTATKETFECTIEPYMLHNEHMWPKELYSEFAKWAEGRIISREVKN